MQEIIAMMSKTTMASVEELTAVAMLSFRAQ
jgi:hypothetical protein